MNEKLLNKALNEMVMVATIVWLAGAGLVAQTAAPAPTVPVVGS